MRRAIEIEGLGITLEITKAASIRGNHRMIVLEEYKPNEWRLIFSADLVEDWSQVISLKMIRED